MTQTTHDGQPIAPDPPFGASIIVYRRTGDQVEFLILHRAHHGIAYEGDWAWTPPAGARWPGEPPHQAAQRELKEETGLETPIQPTNHGTADWLVYQAEIPPTVPITLDAEHDRYAWLNLDQACARCAPQQVANQIRAVAQQLGL